MTCPKVNTLVGRWRLPDGTDAIVEAFGDSSVLVVFSHADDAALWSTAQGVARAVRNDDSLQVTTVTATYDSVFVEFHPDRWTAETFAQAIAPILNEAPFPPPTPQFRVTIPVVYGGDFGPDIGQLSGALGITEEVVAAAHSSMTYTVRGMISPPGAPMLDAPAALSGVPRLSVPRARVPAGSVAIAGSQCMIYATASPGGWNLIGRTPSRLVDPASNPPVMMSPGDLIEFAPISADEWDRFAGQAPTAQSV